VCWDDPLCSWHLVDAVSVTSLACSDSSCLSSPSCAASCPSATVVQAAHAQRLPCWTSPALTLCTRITNQRPKSTQRRVAGPGQQP
jgi:hypothetical protein